LHAGWIAILVSLAVAAVGFTAERAAGVAWAGVFYFTGLSAFVGCFTNKLAIKALFDPWPTRRLALPGTGVIRRKSGEIARQVARTVSEKVMTPEVFRAKSTEAIGSAVEGGVLDSDEVYFSVREVIERAGGVAGKVGHITGFADYDVLAHNVLDSIKGRLRGELASPEGVLPKLIDEGARAMDVEGIVRERLEAFGPGGMRDLAYELAGRHLVWLEVWGAVFGGLAGALAWLIAAR